MDQLPTTWQTVLEHLRQATKPQTLQELGSALDIAPSTLHRQLAAMIEAGLLERQGERKQAHYTLLAQTQVRWIGPQRPIPTEKPPSWHHWHWRTTEPTDWRFPLADRIPDPPARRTMLRFLGEAHARGMLTPWIQFPNSEVSWEGKQGIRRKTYLKNLADTRLADALLLAVFGSCARGDARTESDIDLLIIGPPEGDYPWRRVIDEIGFQELAWEIGVGSERPIQTHIFALNEFIDLPNTLLRDKMLREGVTIYTSTGHGPLIEDLGVQNDIP